MAHRYNSPRVRFNPETVETSFGGTQLSGHIRESSILSNDSRLDVDTFTAMKTQDTHFLMPSASKTSRSVESHSQLRTPKRTKSDHGFVTPTKTSLQYSIQARSRTPVRKHSVDILKHGSQTPECFNPVTIETPQPASRHRHSEELLKSEDCGITVAVRVRPFSIRFARLFSYFILVEFTNYYNVFVVYIFFSTEK